MAGAGGKLGQAMVGLGSDDHIGHRRTAQDFIAFSLSDAAGHRDKHLFAIRTLGLHVTQATKIGKELLRRLLANMAGIDQNQISIVRPMAERIAVLF